MTESEATKPWWAASSASRAERLSDQRRSMPAAPTWRRWSDLARRIPGKPASSTGLRRRPCQLQRRAPCRRDRRLRPLARDAGRGGAAGAATRPCQCDARQGAVESLPFEDASLRPRRSAATARITGATSRPGLREAARVLKPGGTAGFVDADRARHALSTPTSRRSSCCATARMCATIRGRSGKRRSFVPGSARPVDPAFRVQLEFNSWVERMATPSRPGRRHPRAADRMSSNVTGYFETDADGSFAIDVALIEARKLP